MRRRRLMYCLVVVLAVVTPLMVVAAQRDRRDRPVPADPQAAPTFEIKDWEFRWTAAKAGDAQVLVIKSQDRLVMRLVEGTDSLTLTPAEAAAIGAALSTAEDYRERLRSRGAEGADSLEVVGHAITFNLDAKYGFSVRVRPAARFSFTSIALDADQAVTLGPILVHAEAMAKYVDERIKP